jgi:hypothetical protein
MRLTEKLGIPGFGESTYGYIPVFGMVTRSVDDELRIRGEVQSRREIHGTVVIPRTTRHPTLLCGGFLRLRSPTPWFGGEHRRGSTMAAVGWSDDGDLVSVPMQGGWVREGGSRGVLLLILRDSTRAGRRSRNNSEIPDARSAMAGFR